MVVLSCAICTKSGKALLSRQFVELTKVRIEGLLAAFPKLMGTGKQHTFIETDTVRYVYQPLESLYILLVTNKNSNILEDLETLHLLAKLVPEYCHVLEEVEITKYAFDLIFAFDEVIAMGYKERVTLQQVKHFTTMESHEEERARIEQTIREAAAKKAALEKQKAFAQKRAEERKAGGGHGGHPGGIGGGMGGGSMGGIGGGSGGGYPDSPQPYVESRKEKEAAPSRASPKGMVLGGKTAKKSALAQVLKEEKIVEKEDVDIHLESSGGVQTGSQTPTENIHIAAEEQLVIRVENDGGLESMEIKGGLTITVNDQSTPKVKVVLKNGDNSKFQFKLHPNADKTAFNNESVIKLKEGVRAFPAPVIRWRLQTSDESFLPLNISCWPSPSSEGQTQVTLEYELTAKIDLRNVSIVIPVPGSSPPVVSKVEGHYDWEGRARNLVWKLPIIDSSNRQGGLEFNVPNADPKGFFPLQVSFSANKTFCSMQVQEVVIEDTNNPVKFSEATSLTVDRFEVV